MLNKIEIKLLLDIYDMDINNGVRLHDREYDLQEKNKKDAQCEFGNYLLKLERLGYIKTDKGAFITGGQHHERYRNNIIMYFDEKIHITHDGIKLAQEIQKTVLDKAKEEAKDVVTKVYEELKDFGTKAIAEYFIRLTKS